MAVKKTPAKAAPAKTAVAVRPINGIVPGGWRERAQQSIARNKERAAELPTASGNFVSFKNGTITIGGRAAGNMLPVVIFDTSYLRQYFSKQYSPDSTASPDCWSLVKGGSPHPEAAIPQNDTCHGCRWDEFKSASNQKGKACQEGGRFVFIEASALESPAAVMAAPIWSARASFNNAKVLQHYVSHKGFDDVPLWSIVTEVHCNPDDGTMYALDFVPQQITIEEDILDALAARIDEAKTLLVAPFPVIEPPAPPVRAPSRGAPTARRKF